MSDAPTPAAPVPPEPTPEPAVVPEPTPEPAVEPEPGVVPEPAAAAAPEPTPEPAVVPEPTPGAAVVPEPDVVSESAAAAARPVTQAPGDAELVPLEDLAPAITAASTSRRAFLGFGLAIAGGVVGAAALARFTPVFADEASDATPIIPTYDPGSRQWTYVVDTSACIGCGLCVVACKEENHVPEEGEYTRTWIERHVVTTDGELHVDSPDGGMHGFPFDSVDPGAAGKAVDDAYFVPRLCMQCENSPCTAVCPVGATYRTEDGIILVDARRCIGCGYCVVACPYGARYIVPAAEQAPNDTPGVADKCTWCYHRISRNLKPACVEVCPVGARKFGDASDPDSEIATIVREQDPQQLWPEYGTRPRVLYLGPVNEEA